MDIKRVCLVFALAMSGGALALPPIVVTNGLSNACTRCVPRSCVRHNGIPSPRPQFIEREAGRDEIELAVALAITHSRHKVADGLLPPDNLATPTPADKIPCHPLPYSVMGVSLENMSVRAFAFAAHPTFTTNDLHVVLVSFYRGKISRASFLYALYVNDNTGRVSDSVQGCSDYMDFLSKGMKYPYLDDAECEKQQRFVSWLHRRMIEKLPVGAPATKDVKVELVDPCPPPNGR